jgi:hypothetical protein
MQAASWEPARRLGCYKWYIFWTETRRFERRPFVKNYYILTLDEGPSLETSSFWLFISGSNITTQHSNFTLVLPTGTGTDSFSIFWTACKRLLSPEYLAGNHFLSVFFLIERQSKNRTGFLTGSCWLCGLTTCSVLKLLSEANQIIN